MYIFIIFQDNDWKYSVKISHFLKDRLYNLMRSSFTILNKLQTRDRIFLIEYATHLFTSQLPLNMFWLLHTTVSESIVCSNCQDIGNKYAIASPLASFKMAGYTYLFMSYLVFGWLGYSIHYTVTQTNMYPFKRTCKIKLNWVNIRRNR